MAVLHRRLGSLRPLLPCNAAGRTGSVARRLCSVQEWRSLAGAVSAAARVPAARISCDSAGGGPERLWWPLAAVTRGVSCRVVISFPRAACTDNDWRRCSRSRRRGTCCKQQRCGSLSAAAGPVLLCSRVALRCAERTDCQNRFCHCRHARAGAGHHRRSIASTMLEDRSVLLRSYSSHHTGAADAAACFMFRAESTVFRYESKRLQRQSTRQI